MIAPFQLVETSPPGLWIATATLATLMFMTFPELVNGLGNLLSAMACGLGPAIAGLATACVVFALGVGAFLVLSVVLYLIATWRRVYEPLPDR